MHLRASPKPKDVATRCDSSDRWNHAATLWLFSQGASDLTLLGSVAELPPDEDGACPNLNPQDPEAQSGSKPTATRTWHFLSDPTIGSLIEDLTVCSACVGRVNLIFPSLNGVFNPVADGQKLQATGGLLPAHDNGVRSEAYLAQLNDTATQTLKTENLDTRALAAYAKNWAPIQISLKGQHVPKGATRWMFPINAPVSYWLLYNRYREALPGTRCQTLTQVLTASHGSCRCARRHELHRCPTYSGYVYC
ncbi:hypothetical protein BU25DRAFT_410745 [Macroventuria anomochaeta]|uniref:Uncharacterized protein n=1 Tax=Macroventuria anomochaeta TaxID=301207 RepID=A0ACB6RZY0_9PLEO|nr:uncharacterized protein BU25DRAFT_410745 [Macroventuria anomochaeta]KAF2627590.1 hypothetical protein BU25DRAFT_410745 [Macroventuria anomochaeta]